MKNLQLSLLATIFIFLTSCTNPSDSINGQVVVQLEQAILKIINATNVNIYYAVFDANATPSNDWSAESTEENKLYSGTYVLISTESIEEYVSGDKILVYYWTKDKKVFKTLSIE